MLDKRCLALLNFINGECLNSGYKVFSVEELMSAMPESFGMDTDAISECICALAEREYISVKYHDDFEVCACPLTKGRLVFENQIDEQLEKTRAEKRYFLVSFLGAIFGAFFSFLIIFLFLKIGGRI